MFHCCFRKRQSNFKQRGNMQQKNKTLKKVQGILPFIFLFSVIFSRIYIETAILAKKPFFSYFVATHHFCWFLFVFFYFAICCRFILGIKAEKIPLLAILSPVIFVPLIHAFITGKGLRLQYLRGNFSDILFDIFTFYKFNRQDSEFFFEMLILLILFATLSYIISKNIFRTILNIAVGFYGSMFLAGIQFFGVYPRTQAFFAVHTVFKNHILLSLIYFSASLAAFSICFFPEIKNSLKDRIPLFSAALTGGIISAFAILAVISLKVKALNAADFALLTVPWLTIVLSIATLKNGYTLPSNRFFPLFFSVFSLILLLGILFGEKVFI